MYLPRLLALALGTTIGALLPSVAPVELAAQAPTPAALFRESSVAARRIPTADTTRIDLLRRIAHAIIWVGDVDSALVLGQSLGPWRREVQTEAICRLLTDDRFDDAYALVRRFPNEDRDWALANLAVRLVRPLQYPRPTTPDTIVSATLHDRALAVAREIPSAEPRVDAFLEIANRLRYQRDTGRARAAAADALASLPRIRDRDLASSRLRVIIDHLGSAGSTDSALALGPSLLRDDRVFAARGMGWWPDARDPRVRAELLGLVARVDSVADVRVRLRLAENIIDAFKALGDSVTADSVATRLRSDPGAGRKTGQRATATLSVVERAVQLAPSDFRAAVALVDTLDDRLSYGRHARGLARVALAASRANADTAALVLRRARELALARGLSTRQLSLTLLEIAKAQIGRGLVDDGAATLNAIPDRAIVLPAFGYPYGVRFRLTKSDEQRFLASLGDAEVRAAAAANVIGPWLEDKGMSQADFDLAVSVVDSLPRNRSAEAAQNLIARASFFRGDTAAARDRSLSVLRARDRDWSRWLTYPFGDELMFWVVRSGGVSEALAWARALPSPSSRAAGLLEIGDALDAAANIRTAMRYNTALNACRDEF